MPPAAFLDSTSSRRPSARSPLLLITTTPLPYIIIMAHLVNSSQTAPLVDISATASSSLHLNFPATTYGAPLNSRSISRVSVHPAALFSILDHFLRRSDKAPSTGEDDAEDAEGAEKKDKSAEAGASSSTSSNARANRVIGTLLGTHNEGEVEIRSCFAVPHNETDDLVQVDMDYHRQMIELHNKVHPEEVIVGW